MIHCKVMNKFIGWFILSVCVAVVLNMQSEYDQPYEEHTLMWGWDSRSSSIYLCSEGSSPSLKLGGFNSFDTSLFMDTQLCVGDTDLLSVTLRNRKNNLRAIVCCSELRHSALISQGNKLCVTVISWLLTAVYTLIFAKISAALWLALSHPSYTRECIFPSLGAW